MTLQNREHIVPYRHRLLLHNIVYALVIAFIMMFMDKLFAYSNAYFLFDFTLKEYLKKLFFLVLLISLFPKRKMRLLVFLILVTFSLFQYIHFNYFGKNISAIEFFLLSNNFDETMHAFFTLYDIAIVPLGIVFLGFVVMVWIDKRFSDKIVQYRYAPNFFVVIILFLCIDVFYFTNLKEGKLKRSSLIYPQIYNQSSRNFFVSLDYYLFGVLPKRVFFEQKKSFASLPKPQLLHKDMNRTIILLIGESLRADKLSLAKNNCLTPKLQSLKEDSNFYHKVIYSGGTMTKVSVATLLHRLKYPGSLQQIAQGENCLFALAKENDFCTSFISSQKKSQLRIIYNMLYPKKIDKMLMKDDFSHYIKPTGFDEDLQVLVDKMGLLSKNKNLIILQQRGSHVPYTARYPKSFDRYTPYDNSVLYTDTTLFNMIAYLKKHVKNEFFFFYVSDHGELLGEKGRHGHGYLEKVIYRVPFIMYTNSTDKTLVEQFKYTKCHYDLSNFIISLLGYKADLCQHKDRTLYVLNSDLDGFSGYGTVKIHDEKESKLSIKKF